MQQALLILPGRCLRSRAVIQWEDGTLRQVCTGAGSQHQGDADAGQGGKELVHDEFLNKSVLGAAYGHPCKCGSMWGTNCRQQTRWQEEFIARMRRRSSYASNSAARVAPPSTELSVATLPRK